MSRTAIRSIVVTALAATALVVVPGMPAGAGGGGAHCGSEVTEGTGEVVALRASCFSPTVLRVEPGTTVTFVNEDPYEHHISGANAAWLSGKALAEGDLYEVTFEEEGLYPYACYLHVGMIGVVAVGDANAKAGAAVVIGNLTRPSTDAEPVAAGTELPSDRDRPSTGWWLAGLIGLVVGAGLVAGFRNARSRLASAGAGGSVRS